MQAFMSHGSSFFNQFVYINVLSMECLQFSNSLNICISLKLYML